jgi:hypothetical protein
VLELILGGTGWIARALLHALFELAFEKALYRFGWLLLRLATLGRYPPSRPAQSDRVAITIFAVIAVAAAIAVCVYLAQ